MIEQIFNGNTPTFTIQAKTLPQVWEEAVLVAWNHGISIKTQYDNPQDPPSKDCTMIMVVQDPFEEPRLHRAFPGGLNDLESYRQEVVNGIHDHWVKPEEGKWTYTYHGRLFNYKPAFRSDKEIVPFIRTISPDDPSIEYAQPVDQIQFIIDSLAKSTYSRRSQAITYMPSYDQGTEDPPCLQRVWCRIFEDETGNLVLNMNTNWRSRDAYKAAFMNMFALTDLQRYIAEEVGKKLGRPVRVGRYVDMSDSFHIYGKYFNEFKGFLDTVQNRKWEDRVWNSDYAKDIFEETAQSIKESKI